MLRTVYFGLCLSLSIAFAARGEDILGFRGPGGLGVSGNKGLPTEWSDSKNLLWKLDLPGPGASSPILVGDKIFLTCFTGPSKLNPDASSLKRFLVCADRAGNKLWQKEIVSQAKDLAYTGFQALHGYASSTPASDGKTVYVFAGVAGVAAFDLSGNKLWQTSVGARTNSWGSGTSPVLYKDLVIVNASVEAGEIVALRRSDGAKAWSQKSGAGASWNTPILVAVNNQTELVVSAQGKLVGIDPDKGVVLWTCSGINDYVCPSVVADNGIVFAIGGRQNTAVAVKAGGRGDVTTTHRVWIAKKGSNVSSPVYHGGHLYWAHEGKGMAYCLDGKTGEVVYEHKLFPAPDRIYASALVADGKLYYLSRNNGAYVVDASPKFKLLAHNTFASDRSVFNASPVVADGRLYLRSDQALYCLGTK
jgi:outer membrane protein assembly factor BamB